eukprot:1511232-Amphidinium_carterae.1
MLDELRADICAVQETRLELPEDFETKELCCSHSSAVKGRGGLLIVLRKQNRAKLVSFQRVNHRILIARSELERRPLKVICAHAPVRDAPVEDHRRPKFEMEHHTSRACWTRVRSAAFTSSTRCFTRFKKILRLNHSRVDRRRSGCKSCGDLEEACCGQCTYQIDFILGNQLTYDAAQSCAPLSWAQLDAIHGSDHRPLMLHMVIQSRTPPTHTKRKPLVRRFVSEEHRAAFDTKFRELVEGLQTKDKFISATPFKRLLLLQHTAMIALRRTKPTGALTPKKPWLDEAAVRAMSKLNKLRRLRAALSHSI